MSDELKKKIVWESMHYDEPIKPVSETDKRKQFEDDDDDEELDSEKHITKILNTPFGYISIDNSMNPLKQFEFWRGHTNFNVSSPVIKIIKETPGVEVLMPVTRYQFIIATAKLFKSGDVMKEIQRTLCDDKESSQQRNDTTSDSERTEQSSV